MKKKSRIHNLDSLEKEIYRLQLEAKELEEKLQKGGEHLQANYASMFMNSFFRKKKRNAEERHRFFDFLFKNEHFTSVLSRIGEKVSDHSADRLINLIDRLFSRKKETST